MSVDRWRVFDLTNITCKGNLLPEGEILMDEWSPARIEEAWLKASEKAMVKHEPKEVVTGNPMFVPIKKEKE